MADPEVQEWWDYHNEARQKFKLTCALSTGTVALQLAGTPVGAKQAQINNAGIFLSIIGTQKQ